MDDLSTWLLAQVAKDEQDARDESVHRLSCGWIQWDGTCNCGWPARLLAECEAKRHMIGYKLEPNDEGIQDMFLLQLLALSYAERPGYREEWRPEAWELSPIPELKP